MIKLVIINMTYNCMLSTKLLAQAANEDTKFMFMETGRLDFS